MRSRNVFGVVMAFALVGCGDSGTTTTNDLSVAPKPDMTVVSMPDLLPGFQQPAGTVAVNFTIDDTANKIYKAGDLEWKGQMIYDPTTRKISKDDNWGGPFAPLFDDGPWNAGGHEPAGAKAGDNNWGITVFAPNAAAMDISYGLNDAVYAKAYQDSGWLWPPGDNGKFSVKAADATPITASGRKFPAFGTVDFQLVLDTKNLGAGNWDLTKVVVKGSSWQFGFGNMVDDGTGKYTFTLSANIGAGKPLSHSGLLNSGDKPEFLFVLGATNKEYTDGSKAYTTGVTAAYKPAGGSFMPLTIGYSSANPKNTTVTIP